MRLVINGAVKSFNLYQPTIDIKFSIMMSSSTSILLFCEDSDMYDINQELRWTTNYYLLSTIHLIVFPQCPLEVLIEIEFVYVCL